MMKYDNILNDYEEDVEFPDVSGMEHLDMLLTRSEIAAVEQELTETQKQRLCRADYRLLTHAQQFYDAVEKIANLDEWRSLHNVPSAHWWWYLDVISHAEKILCYRTVFTV